MIFNSKLELKPNILNRDHIQEWKSQEKQKIIQSLYLFANRNSLNEIEDKLYQIAMSSM